MRIIKITSLILGVFFIGSSNYILYGLFTGLYGEGFLQGLALYLLGGFTYILGLGMLIGAYLLTPSRDLAVSISLSISGIIHLATIFLISLVNLEGLIIMAPQTGLSITMGIVFIYLAYRKARPRLVEIGVAEMI